VLCATDAIMEKRKVEERSAMNSEDRVAVRRGVTVGHNGRAARALPCMSGDECARVLERCGLVRCSERAGVVWMERGSCFVCVPRCESLPMETLVDILMTSGLSTGDFLRNVGRRPLEPASPATVIN
jgi:hypothetical protein